VVCFNGSDLPQVCWCVVPLHTPRVLRHCVKCGTVRRFASSDRFRLNAQQVTVDVWLIYKCIECGCTWNHAIVERCPVRNVDHDKYTLFEMNDEELAWSCAFDYRLLSGAGVQVDMTVEVSVESSGAVQDDHLGLSRMILIESSYPGLIRLDRLLARQLRISRTCVQELYDNGLIHIDPDSKNVLRKEAHTGQRIVLIGSATPESSR
jgi:hypothetical protein